MRSVKVLCALALTGCGGSGGSDVANKCVEEWNRQKATGAGYSIGFNHTGSGPRRLEAEAKMAVIDDGKCVLIATYEDDKHVWERQPDRWQGRDMTIGTAGKELFQKAEESDEAVEGKMAGYTDAQDAQNKKDSGRFVTD